MFDIYNLRNNKNYSNIRLTLDKKEDLVAISNVFNNFNNNMSFSYKMETYLKSKKFKPKYKKISKRNTLRNYGLKQMPKY